MLRLRVSIATNVHPANELSKLCHLPKTELVSARSRCARPYHQHSPGFFRATTPILTAKESFRYPSPHECAELEMLEAAQALVKQPSSKCPGRVTKCPC